MRTPTRGITGSMFVSFFFFNDTATTEIYTLSLHDALPISCSKRFPATRRCSFAATKSRPPGVSLNRSEEHTSELQSQSNLVCRLLLEKKKGKKNVWMRCNNQKSTVPM